MSNEYSKLCTKINDAVARLRLVNNLNILQFLKDYNLPYN
jgi:hypothetical protein